MGPPQQGCGYLLSLLPEYFEVSGQILEMVRLLWSIDVDAPAPVLSAGVADLYLAGRKGRVRTVLSCTSRCHAVLCCAG